MRRTEIVPVLWHACSMLVTMLLLAYVSLLFAAHPCPASTNSADILRLLISLADLWLHLVGVPAISNLSRTLLT